MVPESIAGSATLFCNARIHAIDGVIENGWVTVQSGRISCISSGGPCCTRRDLERIDLHGARLVPGFIDVHAHGAMGCDTMDADGSSLRTMARFYAQHGVTGFLATTMTAPAVEIEAALQAVSETMQRGTGGAALLGAHVEGPYLDVERRGAQDGSLVRPAHPDEYQRLFETGVVRLLTLAPEIPENRELIRFARAHGATVSAGHTRAGYEGMRQAVRLGLTHVTHLYNGMEPMHHRRPGALGAALLLDGLTCELIADGIHVHPAMLALAYRLKGNERIVLVSDAMSGTGMPDGDYVLGGQQITVTDGVARTQEGVLAGSTLTLDRALATMMAATGVSLAELLPTVSRVPARTLGLRCKGDIAVGYDADLTVLDDASHVQLTMVGGEIVYRT